MPFAIPSGIIITQPSCLERTANTIHEIGIFETKSIGPVPRTVPEAAEVLIDNNKEFQQIKLRQTLDNIVYNEVRIVD